MLRFMKRRPSMITVLLLLAAPLGADDWPQWRGPEGIGVSREDGLPTRWGSEEGVVWKVPLEGVGTSSPTVAGGQGLCHRPDRVG